LSSLIQHHNCSGLKLANELNNRQLYRDLGTMLETAGQLDDAAAMFVSGEQHDKAALIYIRSKNWAKVFMRH
jgi:hypothetical protein